MTFWTEESRVLGMQTATRMTDPTTIGTFIQAGNATFTITSAKTGKSFTYRVQKPKADKDDPTAPMFVKVLTGANNEDDYTFAATLWAWKDGSISSKGLRQGKKGMDPKAPSVRAFAFLLDCVHGGALPEGLEFRSSGRCCRCNRKLTHPDSIDMGIGPECANK